VVAILGDIMEFEVRTNFADADYWIQARGQRKHIGTPKNEWDDINRKRLKTASRYDIGIKVPEGVNKKQVWDFLWRYFNAGYWKRYANQGTRGDYSIRLNAVSKLLREFNPEEKQTLDSELIDSVDEYYNNWREHTDKVAQLLMTIPEYRKKGKLIQQVMRDLI
jgi:hypothetical protein